MPSMRCNYGCVPEGGLLNEREAHLLLADVWELAGDHQRAATTREQWGTPAAAESERQLRELMREMDMERRLRQKKAERDGTAMYVRGRAGGLTRTPRNMRGEVPVSD